MSTSPFNKVIIQGKLSFGKERTFDKAIEMFDHLVDVRFKNAILMNEEHLNRELFSLDFDRTVVQASPKYFRNTVKLIQYLSQFAISGNIGAWMIDEGQILEHHFIEPDSEKIVVQAYLEGRALSKEEGKEEDALQALDKALKKYDRHSQAYERRGAINYKLGNKEDSIYDFKKSIQFDQRNAEAHLGLGQIMYEQKKYKEAVNCFDLATKAAVALQPAYWIARRMKGASHIKLKEFDKAVFDLGLFSRKKFTESDPNYVYREKVLSQYGMALLEMGDYEKAVEAFDQALQINSAKEKDHRAQQLLHRGIAKHKSGGSGFLSDWEEAATLGELKAKKLLETHSN